ncbi:hypothetical protein NQZ68_013052 [Dissostichus eleginoides]|nr:hypothetical protein NQZ68_013052 [Dissostichus eleginoides]
MERCREENDGKSGRQPFNWSSGVLSVLKKNGCWEQTGAIFGGWPYIRSFDTGPNEPRGHYFSASHCHAQHPQASAELAVD